MNRYSIEEFYRIPDLRLRLDRAARRNRARALRAGFVWLLTQARARLAPYFHSRPSRWIERLG